MRKRIIVAFVPLLAFISFGCSHHDPAERLMIFRYNEPAGITSLDPAYSRNQALNWVCAQLYNGLVQLDSNLNVQPSIAKRWTISDNACVYTFTLRDDVFFHRNTLFGTADSTRRVVAQDFLYSFNRILDDKVASPGLWIMSEVAPNGFAAPNDSTFIITLSRPYSPFLGMLAMPYCSVVPHEVVEHYGADFRRHPCGTGPFQLQLWKEDVKLVMRRNPHYFEHDSMGNALPYLDAVAISFIIDRQTGFLEFVKGNFDFMNSLDASYKDELLTRTGQLKNKYASRINMQSIPFLNTEYLGFNLDSPDSPIHDRRIRQAINYGFDRVKMMKYLRNNIGAPGIYGFIPRGLPGFDTTTGPRYYYNPDRTRKLLAEAGYPDGKGLPPLSLTTTANYLDLCKYIQQQLQLLGIDIKIDVTPPAALSEQVANGKVAWFRKSWIADYPDAENYLSLFYSPNFAPNGPNYTHFSNKQFDKLYTQARQCADPAQRISLYHTMDSLIMDQAPVLVLYYDQILRFSHKNVSGLHTNALNNLDLRQVVVKKRDGKNEE